MKRKERLFMLCTFLAFEMSGLAFGASLKSRTGSQGNVNRVEFDSVVMSCMVSLLNQHCVSWLNGKDCALSTDEFANGSKKHMDWNGNDLRSIQLRGDYQYLNATAPILNYASYGVIVMTQQTCIDPKVQGLGYKRASFSSDTYYRMLVTEAINANEYRDRLWQNVTDLN